MFMGNPITAFFSGIGNSVENLLGGAGDVVKGLCTLNLGEAVNGVGELASGAYGVTPEGMAMNTAVGTLMDGAANQSAGADEDPVSAVA
jgi:hypothetical protein